MANTKIAKESHYKIALAVCEHGFLARLVEKHLAASAIANQVLDLVLGEKHMKAINALPKEFFQNQTNFILYQHFDGNSRRTSRPIALNPSGVTGYYIRGDEFAVKMGMAERCAQEARKTAICSRPMPYAVLCSHDLKDLLAIMGTDRNLEAVMAAAKNYETTTSEIADLLSEVESYAAKVIAMLKTARTFEKLEVLWPEIMPIANKFRAPAPAPKPQLPVDLATMNAVLGLPPEAAEVEPA